MLRALREVAASRLPARRVFPGLAASRAGAAVGPSALTAVLPAGRRLPLRPGTVLRRPLRSPPDDGAWPELAEALGELRGRLGDGVRRPRLDLALQPPLACARAVRLPPAGRSELRRVLRREIARHFLEPPPDPVADAAPVGGRREGPCVAVAASRPVVSAVADAAREAGWTPGVITAADWALTGAVARLDRGARSGAVALAVRTGRREARIELDDGRFTGVRPGAPAGGGDGDPAPAHRIGPEGGGPRDLSAGALAGFGAMVAPDDGPTLAPPDIRRAERRRIRLRAGLLAGVATGLIGLAAALHLWGLDREISAVEAFRAERGEDVTRLTAAREASDLLGDLVASVSRASASRAGWSRLVAEVGERLPASAHLESLSTTDDGLALTGRARSPSALVPALEGSPAIAEARLAGVGRTEQAGMDGFRLELTRADAPSAPPGAGAGTADPATRDAAEAPEAEAASDAAPGAGGAPPAGGDPRFDAPGGAP